MPCGARTATTTSWRRTERPDRRQAIGRTRPISVEGARPPWTWVPVSPWPGACAICQEPIDATIKHGRESQGGRKHPLGETIGHEPPVAWMLAHPEHDGPLVLRPYHWACNAAKSDKPDWERERGGRSVQ